MTKLRSVGLLLLLALCSVPANAGVLSLAFDSRGVDLNALEVGDDVTIDVLLNLMSVGSLTDLGVTVGLAPGGDFMGPSNGTVGSIVPDPSDVLFSTFPGTGIDAQFLTLFSANPDPNIASSGVFFSFDLIADRVGAGTIAFDPFSLLAADDAGNFYFGTDFDTNELSYTINSGSEHVIPEPSSIGIFLVLSAATMLRIRGERRRLVTPS